MSGTIPIEIESVAYNAPMEGSTQKWGTVVVNGNIFVPCDPANRDFQSYLLWLDAGNAAPAGAPTRADFP